MAKKTNKKSQDKNIKICPKCGSINLTPAYLMSPQKQTFFNVKNKLIFGVPKNIDSYGCEDCGYYGITPEVKMSELKKLVKITKNKAKVAENPVVGINTNPKLIKIMSFLALIAFLILIIGLFFVKTPIFKFVVAAPFVILGVILIIEVIWIIWKPKKVR